MNFSEGKENTIYSPGSHEENVFFATLYIIVLIVSVPCNVLALWVFSHSKNSSSKVFLLNLAIADMCFILVLPMRVIYHASDSNWPLGEASCRLVGFLFFINLYYSMYLIPWIGLDRLFAISLAPKCQSLRTSKNARVVCAILWVFVTCSTVPLLFKPQTMTLLISERNVTVCNQLYLENRTSFTALVSTIVAIAIPLVVLTVSYILIFLKLRVMTFHQRTSVQNKALRMILLTLATFILTFVPYHVHRCLYIERHRRGNLSVFEGTSLAFGNRLTSAFTCVSGIMDPVMYFFLARTYQKTLLQLCGRATNNDRLQSTT